MKRALAFLSVVGSAESPNESTLAWFPAVGLLLGLAVGAVWWLVAKAWPPAVAAAIVVVVDVALTGFLHVDGLVDSGDGLLAPLSREQRLAAMADPRVGAFGAIALVAVLLLRYGALAAQRPSVLALAGLWCASRSSMVLIVETQPYARPGGLVTSFLNAGDPTRSRRALTIIAGMGILAAVPLVLAGRGYRGLGSLGAELVAMVVVVVVARRRLGGFTGDVLGAAAVVGETVALVVLASR